MVNISEKNKSILQTDNAGRALYVNSECLFLLDHNSLVDRTVIEEGFWELKSFTILTNLSRRLLQASNRHNIFVDCGAYFGFYTFKIFYLDLFDRIKSSHSPMLRIARLAHLGRCGCGADQAFQKALQRYRFGSEHQRGGLCAGCHKFLTFR